MSPATARGGVQERTVLAWGRYIHPNDQLLVVARYNLAASLTLPGCGAHAPVRRQRGCQGLSAPCESVPADRVSIETADRLWLASCEANGLERSTPTRKDKVPARRFVREAGQADAGVGQVLGAANHPRSKKTAHSPTERPASGCRRPGEEARRRLRALVSDWLLVAAIYSNPRVAPPSAVQSAFA